MNEQIQNLKDKIWTEEYWTNPNTDKLLPAQLNRFAELIVRECANHCDLLLDHKISSEWSRGTHDCSRAIKKHFGVEE
jgi:hypothetical protein